jgi:AcrR family transcriptional regulator
MIKKGKTRSKKTTEQKIKDAAQKLFTQKGFAAIKTRDIAKEAGINLALLNYYFRSKEKLFEIIMRENLARFLQVIRDHYSNTSLSLEDKIEFLVSSYIDMLIENPDLPLFVLYEMQSGKSNKAPEESDEFKKMSVFRNTFFKELEQAINAGKMPFIHPMHIVANMIGLTVFPFLAKPMLTERMGKINTKQFNELMLERKKLIPIWMKAMLKAK